jgi:hypothetical protein
MTDFSHIQSDFIREVVMNDSPNIKALYGAVYATEYFCEQDIADTSIASSLILVRETAAQSAKARLSAGDIPGTLGALRDFWSH